MIPFCKLVGTGVQRRRVVEEEVWFIVSSVGLPGAVCVWGVGVRAGRYSNNYVPCPASSKL